MNRRKTDRMSDNAQEIHIPKVRDIFNIFLKRRFLITFLLFPPIILGGIYIKNKPDLYQATATVLIENQQYNLTDFNDVLGDVKFDNLTVPTQVQVISSPNLAQETIKTLNLEEGDNKNIVIKSLENQNHQSDSAVGSFQITQNFLKNLSVKQQGASRIIEISYKSQNPEIAAFVANGHAKQYVYAQIRVKKQQANILNNWISKQIVQLKEESIKKSRAAQKFRSDTGMVFGKNSQELVYQQISDIAAQITSIETKEMDLKARQDMLSGKSGSNIIEVVDSYLIQSLKSELSSASQKLQSLRSDQGERHPQVVALRQEIDQINGDIAREISNIKKSIQNDLGTITKQKELLKSKLLNLQKEADVSQVNQITLQSLQVEEAASAKILDSFLERSEQIKSQIDFTRPDVRIVSFADIPAKPIGFQKNLIILIIVGFSLILALSIAILVEHLDDRIRNKDEIRRLLNLKAVGLFPKEINPIKSTLERKRTAFTEEIKRVYIHLSTESKNKTIVFCSSHHDEGKSTIALSLGYYLVSIGKNVIVVDADTFYPSLSKMAMIPQEPGFYELLSGISTLNQTIIRDKYGLSFIVSGEQTSFISDLLMAGKFDKYLAILKEKYDYVLIDSSNVLLTSEVEVVARLADQVILVAEWGKTSIRKIKAASEILRQFTTTPPLLIINKMKASELIE